MTTGIVMSEMTPSSKPLLAYGVNGDGLGHAARALVLVPLLLRRYRILICGSEAAQSLLREHFSSEPDVAFEDVPVTPTFTYRRQRISTSLTVLGFLKQVVFGFPTAANRFCRILKRSGAVAVISDFEPVLNRAGRCAGLPVLSLSHQHVMLVFHPESVGVSWLRSLVLRAYVSIIAPNPSSLVLSSFFQPALRKAYSETLLVGGLLRPDVFRFADTASDDGAALVYLRRYSNHGPVLELIHRSEISAHVFGLPESACGDFPRLVHMQRDPRRFLEVFSAAPFVIAAAGHQLLCEAIELRKPVLALYEPVHDEQRMNAVMLEQMGYGMGVSIDAFADHHLQRFLERLPQYRQALSRRVSAAGNTERVVAWMEERLPSQH